MHFPEHCMIQYSLWPNCNNNCKFCLRKNRDVWSKEKLIKSINDIRENISYMDWKNKFADGISLLGGEVYFITDKEIQDNFIKLVDDIIDKILLVSESPRCRYSTVTNGMYNPDFLYRVVDRIIERTGDMSKLDINFSYDMKYRYPTDEKRALALKNIQEFTKRYNYRTGVQMILTQYLIDDIFSGKFNLKKFLKEDIKGCGFCFLYPHPIHSGHTLSDFFFKRDDFIKFCIYLKTDFPEIWRNMYSSTHMSGIYKYTGMRDKDKNTNQEPVLSDGKEEISKCGHSMLYRCYSDSEECMLCDMKIIGE